MRHVQEKLKVSKYFIFHLQRMIKLELLKLQKMKLFPWKKTENQAILIQHYGR